MSENIIRVQKDREHPYTVVSNALLQDTRLSFGARGLMCYLLSKPDHWQARMDDLIAQSPAGRQATQTMVGELLEYRYMTRETVQDERGRWLTVTTVYEEPVTEEPATEEQAPDAGSTVDGPTVDGLPVHGEPVRIVSTDLVSTEKKKANASAKRHREPSVVQAAHQAMFAALRDVCEMDQSLSSNRGRLNRVAKEIVEAGRYSPEQIRAWYGPGGWWYTSDFRGKDRPRPMPEQVPKTLLQAMNAQQPGGGRTIEAPQPAVIQVRTGGQV
jgi:hypothetical protein